MSLVYTKRSSDDESTSKRKPSKLNTFPWGHFLVAAVPVGLLTLYLTVIAPPQLHRLAGASVPLPEFTEFFTDVSLWCEENPLEAVVVALGTLALGFVLPIPPVRYYVSVIVVGTLMLGLCYWCLSAPVDRLLRDVQQSLPERNLPETLKANPGR